MSMDPRWENHLVLSPNPNSTPQEDPTLPGEVVNATGPGTEQAIQQDVQRLLAWQDALTKYAFGALEIPPHSFLNLANFLGYVAKYIQRTAETNIDLCVFCRNNREPYVFYTSHKVRDRQGRVVCPVLRQFVCPICGGTGDRAHTISHCPLTKNRSRRSSANFGGPSADLIKAGLITLPHFK